MKSDVEFSKHWERRFSNSLGHIQIEE